jgi:hypothetical protein
MTDVATFDDTDAEQKLAATRAQFRHILQPADELATSGSFPRSQTMRALTGGGATPATGPGRGRDPGHAAGRCGPTRARDPGN